MSNVRRPVLKSEKSSFLAALLVLEFVGIVAVSLFFGAVAFYRVLGVFGMLHAIAMAWSRNIPFGIEGKEPSFYLRGTTALIVALIVAAACAALAWFAPEAVCAFSEGRECP